MNQDNCDIPRSSRHLSPTARRGLDKLGDALLPGDEEFPSFSRLGCGDDIDAVLDEMPAGDRDGLKLLLNICRFLPQTFLVGMLAGIERGTELPGPLGRGIRFLRMGIKGLLFTLYYSGNKGAGYTGPTPLEVVGYEVSVYTADIDGSDPIHPSTAKVERDPLKPSTAST